MAIQLTEEQFTQLMARVGTTNGNNGGAHQRHFTQCTARFAGVRSSAAVEEFITAITIFKNVEKIPDEDAIMGLPLLLTGEANQWWNGVRHSVATFDDAVALIRKAFAPSQPNFRIFKEIFDHIQPEDMTTDQFVTLQRERLSQLSRPLDEQWQLDMVYCLLRRTIRDRIPRADVNTFDDLLDRARGLEANEQERRIANGNGAKKRIRCDLCLNYGHKAAVCRKHTKPTNKADTKAEEDKVPTTEAPRTPIECYGCGKKGVIRRNCPTCKATPVGFCYLTTPGIERPAVDIEIMGHPGTAYLDSGAKTSLASHQLYELLKKNGHPFQRAPINLTQADGKETPLWVYTTTVKVKLRGREIPTKFIILPNAPHTKTLLGIDFLRNAGLSIDYKTDRWFYSGSRHETYGFVAKDSMEDDISMATILSETTAPPLLSPLPDDQMEYQYGPDPLDDEIRAAIQHIQPEDTWSRMDYMWSDAEGAISNFSNLAKIGLATMNVTLRQDEGTSLTQEERSQMNQLLSEQQDLFAPYGPATTIIEHHIDTGDSPPIASPPYRTTPSKRAVIEKEVSQLLEQNIVEECESAWSSPVVLVPKPNGQFRLCIDYRKLNRVTVPDLYPLPRLDDLIHSTGKSRYISTMDLKSGYYQVKISDRDKDKTTFITPNGTYRFLRLPFGLKNAPATFQRLMDKFKSGLTNVNVLVYLDDIIVLSETFNGHLNNLGQCFARMRQFNLRMNRTKCKFACDEVVYLGHVISRNGIQTKPDKVSAILKMEPPRNIKQLLTFLQTCNWYRRFIPHFAAVARPLTNLTKKDAAWKWDKDEQQAFNALKEALATAPVLRQAEPGIPYTLRTDASSYAIGAALLQGEGSEERPIEYASRLLTSAERNYTTTEREALALVWAVHKFRGYLEECTSIAITDHQPLKWLMSLKSPSGRLARWALQLQPYNLNIEYTPGKANVVADTLSRPPRSLEDEDKKVNVAYITVDFPVKSPAVLRDEQLKDPEIAKIIEALESKRDEEALRWISRGYMMDRGILYRYSPDDETEEAQLVVPNDSRTEILAKYHDSPESAHYGAERTYYKVSKKFYWPGMRNDIKKYVQNCAACQRYKADNQKPTGLLQTPVLSQRFEVIAIDLFGPLPKGPNGETWIFIVEDCASRWIELIPLTQATAENCALALINDIFLRYGLCRRIISDNGTQFISAIMQKICYCFNIEQKFTPVYHPAANMVERKNRDLKAMLSILVGPHHDTWPEKLPSVRFAMNTGRCETTGHTAAYLTFGRELRTPVESYYDFRTLVENENFIPEITPKLLQLADVLKEVKERQEGIQDTRKEVYDQKRRPTPDYKVGDLVLIQTHPLSKAQKKETAKLAPRRDGPYKILRVKGPCSFEIAALNDPNQPLGVYHSSALRPYVPKDTEEQPVRPIRRRGRPKKTE